MNQRRGFIVKFEVGVPLAGVKHFLPSRLLSFHTGESQSRQYIEIVLGKKVSRVLAFREITGTQSIQL